MPACLKIDVISIFPEILDAYLGESMMKRAAQAGLVSFRTIDLRNHTHDVHRSVDDRPYGGGPGMVMRPEPLFEAVEAVRTPESRVILMSPQGRPFTQARAGELSGEKHLILVCGHYEGVDERVRGALVDEEISIGDYVLTNGILPAAVVIDALVRLIPGVLGAGEEAVEKESFQDGLLEHPQYTRPAEFRGMKVPEILLSGNHEEIARWRRDQSLRETRKNRPDLLS
ncbi:MAG TPA: tRNA (guanosine(37)-N1)-methyltransferase TrmD [Kiritimatiellia bacterium]|nr:tRNA (guanosine(37)-N1)-methyltransferase TrmD [Kiritimatiellia bacterium]HNR93915.1 tRNA (guanosine(37)-N1)-methyltransferase TrmD [Kiritimatiellia bacterium]HNS80800.1 tRNA (guanosine(37)-N1)-methyltransferase TrmD [Kiritimatiellia bacterium]HPA77177.1 tRNA (guanosine(37)-N1)-methyltransferase TrmD [Kiritimatiellia bacterium]HQQ04970.1 tRNA (guanosine(37)-N1)-methyltransferase TrmD [Kiritimatiellia bacterium]